MKTRETRGMDHRFNLDDLNVDYEDLGVGPVPVLFIHGFPLNQSSWQTRMESMRHAFRVHDDIRSLGKSTVDKEKASIGLFEDDLVQLLDALHIQQFTVAGVSMGGYILLDSIHRFPERYANIVLCETQCIAGSAEGTKNRFRVIQSVEKSGLAVFAEEFTKTMLSKATARNKRQLTDATRDILLTTPRETTIATLRALARTWNRQLNLTNYAQLPGSLSKSAKNLI